MGQVAASRIGLEFAFGPNKGLEMPTASEKVLAKLCSRSFLSLWSYPSPYQDKGFAQRGEGKELCDLLVVFGNDVIIFSDKSCAYPDTGKEDLDWKRWWKRAVAESVKQISGAERWLRQHPGRVFADSRCSKRLDVEIPDHASIRIHRVVVALNARKRCQRFFGGGSGSLMVCGSAHDGDAPHQQFRIDGAPLNAPFVHVLDDVALHVLMSERDTIGDFIEYLARKEEAMSLTQVLATGEEDLLAHYLTTLDANGKYTFIPPSAGRPDGILVDESNYKFFRGLPQYRSAKAANKISYLWDETIEYFTEIWRDGNVVGGASRLDTERALRSMALARRAERRALGEMVSQLVTYQAGEVMTACRTLLDKDALAYAGVALAQPASAPDDEYRNVRAEVMLAYARSLKIRLPNIEQALVLGFHAPHRGHVSEALLLVDFEDWNEEIERQTRGDMERFGWTATGEKRTAHEFPLPVTREQARRQRQMARQAEKRKKSP
ncbi:hypothetical protein [Tahibacter soli]|uniref:Uncharacterized protein n=1 Tax=Tahibacter soli TaxID=2983605 RepID=A0A9X3YT08_9GAMM|nr:hypothetical protein [Tahibacter soli]MDC8015871.1 hypothetical protein [Tahibacter soli]